MNDWRHWRLKRDGDGFATVILSVADRSVNVLHREALDELEAVLENLNADPPVGVILGTDPDRAFALGADVREFATLESREQALAMLHRGQGLFEEWARLECPTVAAIRGQCLGGGLELALACDYRVAESEPAASLGLPEVRLGIHPGYGGSVRLPAVIGDLAALRMMVSGKSVSAKAAFRLHLIDAMVPRRQLYPMARLLLEQRSRPQRARWWRRVPYLAPLRRAVVWLVARKLKQAARKSHYPAPYRLLEHWRDMDSGQTLALEMEARSVANLFELPQTRQLTRLFLLRQELRAQGEGTRQVSRVHVTGAGVMGGDIAAWCALQGLHVTLEDTEPERIAPAIKRAHRLLARYPEQARGALDRLVPDPGGDGASEAEVVIEAIFEDLKAKRELFRRLQSRMRPDALLASNTSSLPLEQLAMALEDPARLVGIHFFNPVSRMPLVEVIQHTSAQASLVGQACGFVRQIGKVPLTVKSSPGFLVNRVLVPYLLEAVRLLEEDYSAAAIDAAALEAGMPMGPLKLADTVGLDVCQAAGHVLGDAYGLEVPARLTEKVEAGQLGRKTGRGFYCWEKGGASGAAGREAVAGGWRGPVDSGYGA